MKKSLIIILLTITGFSSSNAQMLQFGVKAGVNFSTLEGDNTYDLSHYTNFHFGAVLELGIFQNFSIQPELLYSSQGAKVDSDAVKDIKYDYITVPVLAKFYLITDKLSLEAGPQFSFMINENVPDQFESKTFDFALAGGLAYNITNNFFVQARYVAGLSEAAKDAEITNKVIQLSAGIKF
ncbi:MAG: porin family protein [Flavobacteriaceae bacterium]|nr:porin family protein [Flavobacteriaceae bacterium]